MALQEMTDASNNVNLGVANGWIMPSDGVSTGRFPEKLRIREVSQISGGGEGSVPPDVSKKLALR